MSPDRARQAIELARSVQPDLNIFTSFEDDPAPASESGPLLGVPIVVKDIIDHEGRITTCGSAFYRERATSTAPSILALERAGAVVIGRVGLHEWAFGFSSENPHWGPVRNPWDPATSTGGSSGGSAAAVAAGIVPIALGTDTGGSVRVPAALCGTFGLKVTYGKVPIEGVFPLVPSIDTVGPLADSVGSLAVAYHLMTGEGPVEPPSRPLRLGLPHPWLDEAPASPEVAGAFAVATATLEAMGHEVVDIDLPGVVPDQHIVWALAREVGEVHRSFRERGLPYGEDVAARLDAAGQVTDEEADAGRDWQKWLRAEFAAAFNEVDLLITPTVPVRSKTIGVDEIGGLHYRTVLSWFSAIVNHALLPAVAMPLVGTGAPPLSLQAIGPLDGDRLLLGFARELELSGMVGFTPAMT